MKVKENPNYTIFLNQNDINDIIDKTGRSFFLFINKKEYVFLLKKEPEL